MAVTRSAGSSVILSLFLVFGTLASAHGDESPNAGAPQRDESWPKEVEDLVRRADESAAKQDHRAALELWTAAVGLLRQRHPDSQQLAYALNASAQSLQELGRFSEALSHFEEALAILRRHSQGDQPMVAVLLNNAASTLQRLGRAEEALRPLEEALGTLRRLFPGDHPLVVTALNSRAAALLALGRAAEALPLFDEALGMIRRLYRDDHPYVAAVLDNSAQALHALGRAAEALALQEESLSMRRRLLPGNHPEVAVGLSNMARTLVESLGRAAEALPRFEEALAIWQSLYSDEHPLVATGLANLAYTLNALGRPDEALEACQEALAMRRRLFPPDHPDVAQSLSNLSYTLYALGRPEEALARAYEALAMRRRIFPGDHPDVSEALGHLAGLLQNLGQGAEALALCEEALAMRQRLYVGDHPDVARSMYGLGSALQALGRDSEALATSEDAFKMAVRLGAPDRWRWGVALGRLLIHRGQPALAMEPLESAIEAMEAARSDARGLNPEERSQFMAHLREWGDPYALLVRAHASLGHRREALESLERGRGREMLDVLLRGQVDPLERARARAGERGDVAVLNRIADAISVRAAAEAEVLRRERETEQARTHPGRSREEIRALAAEEARARRALLDALGTIHRLVRDEVPGARPLGASEVQALLGADEWILAYSVSRFGSRGLLVGPASIEVFDVARKDLEEDAEAYAEALSKRVSDPVADLAAQGRRLFDALVPRSVWESVKSARRVYLMADGSLNRIPFETLVVAEKDGKPVSWADVGPLIAYVPSASVLSLLLARPRVGGDRVDLVAVGDPVFARSAAPPVWPASGVLLTEIRRGGQAERLGLRPGDVLVAYDGKEVTDAGTLRAAVEAAGGGRTDIPVGFLREGHRRAVQAASGLLGASIARESPDVAGPNLLSGGPLATLLRSASRRGSHLEPLPGTRAEVERVAEAFRSALGEKARVTMLLGDEAREAGLFDATRSPRVLHLATHGLLDETETASFSSLALTIPTVPVPGDDGFLTLVDLFSRWRGRLEGTDLVVLSACESAKGRMQKAEGMYALPWGFLYAGARAVVGSLWTVEDESTAFLMTDFYRRYLEGEGKDPLGALAAARLATKSKYPHPRHWGAFVFVGAPR